jgi:RNA polymerase sigma-70 factor (ECF subfamily)
MEQQQSESRADLLLRAALHGNRPARALIFRGAGKYLARMAAARAVGRLRAKADASDLAQDAILEAHRHFASFRGATRAEFQAWLRSILKAVAANHARRFYDARRRNVRLEHPLDDVAAAQACVCQRRGLACDSPSKVALRHESRERLTLALKSLPAHYRRALELRYLEERPQLEVARQMRRSLASVEKLCRRGLEQLRSSLGEP